MKQKKVGVIGGGPAGLFAAIGAAEQGCEVVLLERNKRPGAKLLLSGSGQCNLTHQGSVKEFFLRYGDAGRFLKKALGSFSPLQLQEYFQERGCQLMTRDDGKIFPLSGRADDLLTILEQELADKKVALHSGARVLSVSQDNKDKYIIKTEQDDFTVDCVVLTTGGKSYPKTGSTGDGYKIANSLGHTIVKPRPGLTAVLVKEHFLSNLGGMTFPAANIGLLRAGSVIKRLHGDVMITHQGLSGPGVLDNSRWLQVGDTVLVTPAAADLELLKSIPEKAYNQWSKRSPAPLLKECGFTAKFVAFILEKFSLQEVHRLGEVKKKLLLEMVSFLQALPFTISQLQGFEQAMVTCGGVTLDEISPQTMESKIKPGLFFAGEVVDIDGDSGGYNIQAACSMGMLAGRSCGE